MMKRIICLVLSLVLVLGILPAPSFADEVEGVNVWFSASTDESFFVGAETDEVMVLKNITVPYFDLALYGLEEYYFVSEVYGDDGDGQPGSDLEPGTAEYAEGKITMLHLFLYATEIFECGLAPEDAGQGYLYEQGMVGGEAFAISGGCGSSFLTSFWGRDSNLNYYLNYAYPLASEGWGATSDQIILREGDLVTLGHFTSWAFCWDTASVFNFIEADNTEPTLGDVVTLTAKRAGSDFGGSYNTVHTTLDTCPDIYYCLADELYSGDVTEWNYLGSADDNGELLLDTADLGPGEYIIAMAGQYGNENPDDICSAPGAVRLTIVGNEPPHEHHYEAVVTAPTCTEGGYTTYTCECGESYTADETEALGHNDGPIVVENEKPSTCTEGGYYDAVCYCTVCGVETYRSHIEVGPDGHYPVVIHGYPATCTEPGLTDGSYCSVCDETITAQEIIPALGHTPVTIPGFAATCTEDGLTDGSYCSVCDETITAQETIPALGHTPVTIPGFAATCTEDGLTDGSYCSVCDETITAQETIPALGHSYENGSCTVCGEADPDYSPVIASGWSGYTTWTLTESGTLTFSPTGETLNGQTNLKNYWKVNGVLTLPWGEYADIITTVVIEDGIHDIGQMAFYELKNLTTVVLGADVTEIRNYAFKNCTSLTTINLENVDDIREGAFYGCAALENVALGENVNIESWAFARTPVLLP